MEKQRVLTLSPTDKKYFVEEDFKDIPQAIREELLEAVATLAEKVGAILSVGFYTNGNIYIENMGEVTVFSDDIGQELEIKQFQLQKKELLKALKMWYMIYRTTEGQIIKEIVLLQHKNLSQEEIGQTIGSKYGEDAVRFAMQMLEE